MAKKRAKKFYHYECTLSGKKFTRTEKAENAEELVSVEAYYELHPDEDDRPEHIKKEVQVKKETEAEMAAMFASSSDDDEDALSDEEE